MAKVFVITGPSGVGKGTLISKLLERVPGLELSISATTREPREGEVDGRDYHFLTAEEFDRRIEREDFLEFATYSGNRYGTLRSEVRKRLDAGHSVVLEIEVQGAQQVRAAIARWRVTRIRTRARRSWACRPRGRTRPGSSTWPCRASSPRSTPYMGNTLIRTGNQTPSWRVTCENSLNRQPGRPQELMIIGNSG